MIRVLLADDHALVRAGIRSLLGAMTEVAVVGEASSGEEALALAQREQPDVVLMDIAMKGITGLEAAALMRERAPAGSNARIDRKTRRRIISTPT